MIPDNPTYTFTLNNKKPAGFRAPSDPSDLVLCKLSRIQAAIHRLCLTVPTQVHFDTALLTQVLADHLRKNPQATDPYNTRVTLNFKNGHLQIRHYDLVLYSARLDPGSKTMTSWKIGAEGKLFKSIKHKNGGCETGLWKNHKPTNPGQPAITHLLFGKRTHPDGLKEIGKFEYIPSVNKCGLVEGQVKNAQGVVLREGRWFFNPENTRMERYTTQDSLTKYKAKTASLLNAILDSDFKSPKDAFTFLQASSNELKYHSSLAKLVHAIDNNSYNDLPDAAQLKGSFETVGGRTPDVQQYVARRILANMLPEMVKNLAQLHISTIHKLTENSMVLLKTLNTSSQSYILQTRTNLNQHQIGELLTLFDCWLHKTRYQQLSEMRGKLQQYAAHLREKRTAMNTLSNNPRALLILPAAAREDIDVAITAVQLDGSLLLFLSAELCNNRDVVSVAVQNYGDAIIFANQSFHADREIVLKAVTNNGNSLRVATPALRDDKEIVLAAVQEPAGFALKHASKGMRNNRDIVLAAVQARGQSFMFANIRFKHDPEIVLHAVRRWGTALRRASPALQNDKNIVLAAVRNNGLALRYAHPNLRDDLEVVLSAIENKGRAFRFASVRLRNDAAVATAAINKWPPALQYVEEPLRNVMSRNYAPG